MSTPDKAIPSNVMSKKEVQELIEALNGIALYAQQIAMAKETRDKIQASIVKIEAASPNKRSS